MKIEKKLYWKAALVIFFLYLGIRYWPAAERFAAVLLGAAMPLLIGCAVAYLVNILMSWYEKHYFTKSRNTLLIKCRRPVCMLAAFITFVAVVFLIMWLIIPQLVSCIRVILAELPGFLTTVVIQVEKWGVLPEDIADALEQIDWRSRIGQIIQMLTSGLGDVVDILITTVTSVFSWLVSVLMSVIFAIYLLASKETLKSQFGRLVCCYLPKRYQEKLVYLLGVLNDCFHNYIVGQFMDAAIIGLLCTAGMWAFRLPYATMVGALVAFTSLIPVAGAYIGALVGAFMILTVSPIKAVAFLVFITVLQQLEGNIIYPRVVGSSMGLPGIWVLAAVTVGGGVMGIPGMLLGVPLAATIYRLIRDDVRKKS